MCNIVSLSAYQVFIYMSMFYCYIWQWFYILKVSNAAFQLKKKPTGVPFGIFIPAYNPGHNILELYNILVQVRFITCETKLHMQYSKLDTRVASQVAERIKTQDLRNLGNIRKISNLGGGKVQCPVSLQEIRLRQQQSETTQKSISNFSFPVQYYRISVSCSKYLVRDCRRRNISRNCLFRPCNTLCKSVK